MKFAEFQAEIDWWGGEKDDFSSRVENEHAWKVSIETIIERNYNLDIKNPYVAEQINHDPVALLTEYHQQQEQITELQSQLKGILSKALQAT